MRRFKLRKFPLYQICVYLVVRYLELMVNFTSYKRAYGISAVMAKLFYWLDPSHRKIAMDNIIKSGIVGDDLVKAKDIVKKVYQNFGLLLIETLLLRKMLRRRDIDRLVKLENMHFFSEALKGGRGGVLVVAHLGNWELGGVAVSRQGYPLSSIARPMDNFLLNRHLDNLRTKQKQVIIAKYNASARMAEELKSNRLLALLVDQHAGSRGLWINFFGRPASTVKSPAILALRYKSPIIPLKVFRDNGIHRLVATEPIYPDQHDVESLTVAYSKRMELFIKEHPEQWFWLHKRWKKPPESVSAKFNASAEPARE